MSNIFPFCAYRFRCDNPELARRVCPPYDIISAPQERELRKQAVNSIQIELPAGSAETKYENAGKIWQNWKQTGIVRRDSTPAFYVYQQNFSVKGKRISRRGFFCELEIEKPGEGSVLRHELTLSKPKEDRLHLLKKLKANTSPIFGLFQDSNRIVRNILDRICKEKPVSQFKDQESVTHILWSLTDPQQITIIKNHLKQKPVLIADGHHRYETSWNYRCEFAGKIEGSRRMLFYLNPMEDPGLVIFPTHRILRQSDPNFDAIAARVIQRDGLFSLSSVRIQKPTPPNAEKNECFTFTDGKKLAAVRVRSLNSVKRALESPSKESYKLPLTQIHSLLLPELKKEDFIYTHDLKESVQIAKQNGTTAILVPPTTTQELYRVVSAGELMPQKSTYFYPKVITGILFRSLE